MFLSATLLAGAACREEPAGEGPGDEQPAGDELTGEALAGNEELDGNDPFTHGVSLIRRLDTIPVYRRADTVAAVEALREARQRYPDRAGAHYYLGRALQLDTKLAAAETAYRDAVRLDPSLWEVWLRLSQIAVANGRLEDAWEYIQRLEQERGADINVDYQKGNVLSKMGRLEEADRMLRQALQIQPDRTDAWYSLGLNDLRRGRLNEAAEAFSRVLEIDDLYAGAWFNLGNALARLGREAEAEQALSRFAAAHATLEQQSARDSRLQVLRRGAQEDLKAGRLAQAERQIREAEEIAPAQPWTARLRGELLLAEGQREESVVHLRRAATLNSPEPEEHLALARAFRLAQDTEAAAKHEQEARRLLENQAP